MAKIKSFRFTGPPSMAEVAIVDIPASARLVVLLGPNGSGKTTLLHTLAEAYAHYSNQGFQHLKTNLECHDAPRIGQTGIYIRSAYRTEQVFSISPQSAYSVTQGLLSAKRGAPNRLQPDHRVSHNYQILTRRVAYQALDSQSTWAELMKDLVAPINGRLARLFPDLQVLPIQSPTIASVRQPLQAPLTFEFKRGDAVYNYSELSAGEKEAFDILLDFHISAIEYQDSLFCIDEPELHLHSQLQAALLEQMMSSISEPSQLWIATHSIGVISSAMELFRRQADEVTFLELGSRSRSGVIRPAPPSRATWRRSLAVAVHDLADLVSPRHVVICEGRPRKFGKPKNSEFDARIFRIVFADTHPDTEFISAGACTDIVNDSMGLGNALRIILPGVLITAVIDRDYRADHEVIELKGRGIRVLSRYSIENFLWSDEILSRLIARYKADSRDLDALMTAKAFALQRSIGSQEEPQECVKDIDHEILKACWTIPQIPKQGSSASAFAMEILAPLIAPGTKTYADLEADVFA